MASYEFKTKSMGVIKPEGIFKHPLTAYHHLHAIHGEEILQEYRATLANGEVKEWKKFEYIFTPKEWDDKLRNKYKAMIKRSRNWDESDLTPNDFYELINKPCSYCGDSERIGIDRKDSSIGYLKTNCQPCCVWCNFMKHMITHEPFLEHVRKIAKHKNLH